MRFVHFFRGCIRNLFISLTSPPSCWRTTNCIINKKIHRSWKQCFFILIFATIFTYGFLYIFALAFTASWTMALPFSSSSIAYLNSKARQEVSNLVEQTPYLWRQVNYTVKERIQAQQDWVVGLSKIADIQPKKIVIEMPSGYFYFTGGGLRCPYAPKFESRCSVEEMTSTRWWFGLGPWRYFFGLEADAVVTIHNEDFRPTFKVPTGMRQVFYILEPPQKWGPGRAPLGYNDALLASYWRGSDIPIPYRQWIPGKDSRQEQRPINKRRLVAAMISNCWSKGRLKYIKYLQQFIPVDVYGSCGSFSCAKSNYSGCLAAIGQQYKFFLSFENNKCEDYITEKFFENALNYDMVPVVFGARPSDYAEAGPPSSFIAVDNYRSPRDLADYLLHLDKNDDKYAEYFAWRKENGEISTGAHADFFCRLCGLLHYADYIPPPSWGGASVTWASVNKCLGKDSVEPWPTE